MFNVYEFCCFNLLRKTCTAFLFNEAVLKFGKLPCLISLNRSAHARVLFTFLFQTIDNLIKIPICGPTS